MAICNLPESLSQRSRWLAERDARGEFVLCWLHNALRAHENPALDAAIVIARQLNQPLLVYHGLSENYRFSSDRLHAFMLQGHRDLQRELADKGIRSCFDLQRAGHRGPHLRDLTKRAAVLVTDEMPVQPITGWLQRLKTNTVTPILCVDSSCIVPVPLLNHAYTRAFKFRDATAKLYAQRVSRAYRAEQTDCRMFDGDVPFDSLSLADHTLTSLIAQCGIDHTVGPVADTPGGSWAGYQRWERFKKSGLSQYAKRRNNAAIHEGVSRMSGYLHFGMVSPFRLAREADELSADKYLDELLIWRELAFHFCFHHSQRIDTLEALPPWARETLKDHAGDAREANFSWETLARAKTDQRLWDACQRSLLKHGELHNNVRMTWGKALLPWVDSAERALELTLDLNHRYALDGRDPSSYGGILWCFGQFDRPFTPEANVLGSVRPRPLSYHQRRLDVDRFTQVVDRPISENQPRVAVIGAGLAGLMAARTLSDHGIEVEVFEKSRGVGGRLATKRTDQELGFDHGAQYFTVKDDRFDRYVQSWIHDGVVQRWDGRIVELEPGGKVTQEKTGLPRYVGVPGMNALGKHLATGLSVTRQTLVTNLSPVDSGWLLKNEQETSGPFDVVIVNCPAPQAAALLQDHSHIGRAAAGIKMRPCWAILVKLPADTQLDFDAAFINRGPISWIANNSQKPGRNNQKCWVIHASASWSEANLERDDDDVSSALQQAFQEAIGQRVSFQSQPILHRWRYAIPESPLQQEYLWDASLGLGACGDWCGGPRVEGAFLSGAAMAGAILRGLTIDQPIPRGPAKLFQPSLLE